MFTQHFNALAMVSSWIRVKVELRKNFTVNLNEMHKPMHIATCVRIRKSMQAEWIGKEQVIGREKERVRDDLDHLKYSWKSFPLSAFRWLLLSLLYYLFHPFADIMHMHAFMVGWLKHWTAPLDSIQCWQSPTCT